MKVLGLTGIALIAAAGIGTASAAPANLAGEQQAVQRSDTSAVTPVWHYGYTHYGYYGYYGYPRYYYPRYYGYYGYQGYYNPYYYSPYYYGPGIGIYIR